MHRPGEVVGFKNSKKFKRLDLLLYCRQSGFRRMYTTETALMKLVDELLFSLDNNHVCGMVLVDYRKAIVAQVGTVRFGQREACRVSLLFVGEEASGPCKWE